ncbi:MAG: PspC domain-containing protein [Candidatus Izemoplasmatales bacterium]|jgi:phage shock protein C|nr:PspC domain-containing protein [Candidatus Izemoplasmatales bacterium]MDD4595344.1 PspC domain-containing protein [Candidatus Izemoplasmatales bacterium]
MTEKKRLYRDTENQKIFGVCAGLSDYFEMDVTLIRIIWVFLVLFAGTGLIAYLILALLIEPKSVVMKKMDDEIHKAETIKDNDSDDPFAKFDKKK